MSDPFFDRIRPLRDTLGELVGAATGMRDAWSHNPAADSEGMAELAAEQQYAGAWGTDPIRRAHYLAVLRIVAAEDHVTSLRRIFADDTDPVPVFSPIVLARAALEACGRAGWMLEPGVGTRGRVARSMTEQLYDIAQAQRFDAEIKHQPGRSPAERRARILAEAERQGFRKRTAKRGRPAEIEVERPSGTEVVRVVLEGAEREFGADVFRYHSAVAHATLLGLMASVDPTTAISNPAGGDQLVAIVTDTDRVNILFGAVAIGHIRAVNTHYVLFGWQGHEAWERAREHALREISARMPKDSG